MSLLLQPTIQLFTDLEIAVRLDPRITERGDVAIEAEFTQERTDLHTVATTTATTATAGGVHCRLVAQHTFPARARAPPRRAEPPRAAPLVCPPNSSRG